MKDSYNLNSLLLSMAGSGNPWAAITPFRKGLLRALHDGLSVSDMANLFGESMDKIEKDLRLLIAANLLARKGRNYVPTFFIANASETQRVIGHAQTIGDLLARRLRARAAWITMRNRSSTRNMIKKLALSILQNNIVVEIF